MVEVPVFFILTGANVTVTTIQPIGFGWHHYNGFCYVNPRGKVECEIDVFCRVRVSAMLHSIVANEIMFWLQENGLHPAQLRFLPEHRKSRTRRG